MFCYLFLVGYQATEGLPAVEKGFDMPFPEESVSSEDYYRHLILSYTYKFSNRARQPAQGYFWCRILGL